MTLRADPGQASFPGFEPEPDQVVHPPGSCPQCGSTRMVEGPGAGPHWKRLECARCGRFVQWMPKPAEAKS